MFGQFAKNFANNSCSRSSTLKISRQFATRKRRKSKPPVKPSSKSKFKNSKVKALPPISEVITSPKVQKKAFNKLVEFQKELQSRLMPQFLKDGPSLGDRQREVIVMDLNWWLRNLAIACIPGLTVASVCKFYEKDMEDFYRQQKLLEENKANGGSVAMNHDVGGNADHEIAYGEESGIWARRKTSIWDAAMAAFGLQSDNAKISDDEDPIDNEGGVSTATQQGIKIGGVDEAATSQSSSQINKNEENRDLNDKATIDSLIRRIETLEKQLKPQEQRTSGQLPNQTSIRNKRSVFPTGQKRPSEENDSNEIVRTTTVQFDMNIAKEGINRFLKGKGIDFMERGVEVKRSILDVFRNGESSTEESNVSKVPVGDNNVPAKEIELTRRTTSEYPLAQDGEIENANDSDEAAIHSDDNKAPKRWFHKIWNRLNGI